MEPITNSTCVIDVCVNVNVTCRDGVDLNNLTASNRVTVTHAGLYYVALNVTVRSVWRPHDVKVCQSYKVNRWKASNIQCAYWQKTSSFNFECHRADEWQLDAGDEVSVHGIEGRILFSALLLSDTL
jgi:hypothetical protein